MHSLLLAFFAGGLMAQSLPDAAFAADPEALLTAAKAARAETGDEAVIVLDEHHYAFDKQGRLTREHRQILFLRKASAVDGWSTISEEWAPWHQERPQLEARVVTAQGMVHQLDPKTIAESPVRQFDASIFSDQRQLQAPLPAVAEGAVVEWRSRIRETAPVLSAGVAFRIEAGSYIPVARTRMLVESEVPLRHLAHGLEPQLSQAGGRTVIRVDLGPQGKPEERQVFLPRDEPARPT